MKSSREQFEEWAKSKWDNELGDVLSDGAYAFEPVQLQWEGWQASRSAIASALTPAYWITYWPDTPGNDAREHSHSGPESCARRIASEIGGYVVPVYYGAPS